MTNSYAEQAEVPCPKCGHEFKVSFWTIIDGTEHPELLEAIKQGSFHALQCPRCSFRGHLDTPVLVLRPDSQPALLFCPGDISEEEQEKIGQALLDRLKTQLGDDWREAWNQHIPVVKSKYLAVALSAGVEAALSQQRQEDENVYGEALAARKAFDQLPSDEKRAAILESLLHARHAVYEAGDLNPAFFELLAKRIDESLPGSQDQAQLISLRERLVSRQLNEELRMFAEAGSIGQAVKNLMNARSFDEFKRLLHKYPEVLTDDATNLLRKMIEVDPRPDVREVMERRLDFFHRIQQVGEEKALEEFRSDTLPNWREERLQALLVELMSRTDDENDIHRIELCRDALDLLSGQESSLGWAAINQELGNLLLFTKEGDRVENIELAITHFAKSLEVFTRGSHPEQWILGHVSLGYLYMDRSRGDKSENLEMAINNFSQSLELLSRESDANLWASTNNYLANTYQDRIRGTREENLRKAEIHYLNALEVFDSRTTPYEWAINNYYLGSIYLELSSDGAGDNPDKAITHLTRALQIFTPEDYSYEWARTEFKLANAYHQRVHGNEQENNEEAIAHCTLALRVLTLEAYPSDWAALQGTMGNLYSARTLDDQADNIERALFHDSEALRYYTQESHPEMWAASQYNLAHTYQKRIRGGREQNIEQAIHCYEQSLIVRKREAYPEEWAIIQNDLGGVYQSRIQGSQEENLGKALFHLNQALEVYNRADFPYQWARVQHNLGILYSNRRGPDRPQDLEEAIDHLSLALEVRTRSTNPGDWAMTQGMLGALYSIRIRGNSETNFRRAIYHFREALRVRTRKSQPVLWAFVQINMGHAYTGRRRSDSNEEMWERAVYHLSQGLAVLKLTNHPVQIRDVAQEVGNIYFLRKQWHEAARFYEVARQADEVLFQQAVSRKSRERELVEAHDIVACEAYAMARDGQLPRALEVIEAGRVRLMSDALERKRRDIERLSEIGYPDLRQKYEELSLEWENLGRDLDSDDSSNPGLAASLERKQAELDQIVKRIQALPGYESFMMSLSADQLIAMGSRVPLVYLVTTPIGGLALIVKGDAIIPVWLDAMSALPLLEKIMFPGRELPKTMSLDELDHTGYLATYDAWRSISGKEDTPTLVQDSVKNIWMNNMEVTTHWLWDVCMEALILSLKDLNISQVVLIPSGLLTMVPLHAAWTIVGEQKKYAIDDITISYAQSGRAFMEALGQASSRNARNLLAIDDPSNSLSFSNLEIDAALNYFAEHDRLRIKGKRATRQFVIESLPGYGILHFSTHGRVNWEFPLLSGVLMANDQLLTLQDFFDLELNHVRLAILSACETGLPANLLLLDEVISLPTGLLQASVPGVIASLWSVNDLSTALLMMRFYELWQSDHVEPVDALRHAQIWLRNISTEKLERYLKGFIQKEVGNGMLRKTADNLYKYVRLLPGNRNEPVFGHPYWWAGFSYYGV